MWGIRALQWSPKMKQSILLPHISVADIKFGDKIELYANRHHEYSDEINGDVYEAYTFSDVPVTAYVELGLIESIRCTEECIWNGTNIIGLTYEEFKKLYSNDPDAIESLSVMQENGLDQEQEAYDYDELGIQLWVYENKIVTVMAASIPHSDE